MTPELKALNERYTQLRAGVEEIRTRAQDEGRDITDAELATIRRRVEELGELADEIDEVGGVEAMRRSVGELAATLEAGTGYQNLGPAAGGPSIAGDTGARQLLEMHHRSGALPDAAAGRVEQLLTDGRRHERSATARWFETAGDPAYLGAFVKTLTDPVKGHLLWTEPERAAYQRVQEYDAEQHRSMGTGAGVGGELIPAQLDPAIRLTSDGSLNPLRRISRVVQTAADHWVGVTSAGATAEWKAEHEEVAETIPPTAPAPIAVHFGDAFTPYSFEIGMDAVDFSTQLATILQDAADQLQSAAFTTGSGDGQPAGVITGATTLVNTGGAFGSPNVYALQNALPPRFQPRARWCATLTVINTLAQMETTNGARLFPELSEGRLLRRSIHELSNMSSDMTTTGSKFLLYGDFNEFVIADRIGSRLEIVPHLFGENQRPTAERGALLWFRTGSSVIIPNAFRTLNKTT